MGEKTCLSMLHAASRTIIRSIVEKVWVLVLPVLHRLHRRLAPEC